MKSLRPMRICVVFIMTGRLTAVVITRVESVSANLWNKRRIDMTSYSNDQKYVTFHVFSLSYQIHLNVLNGQIHIFSKLTRK